VVVSCPYRRDGWYSHGAYLTFCDSGFQLSMRDAFYEKRVVILGLARQGKALAKFASSVGAHVVASDLMSPIEGSAVENELSGLDIDFVFGAHPLSLLDGADVISISGGVPSDAPIVKEAMSRHIPITNDSFEFMKRVEAPVIGITGSAGKTTTTALTGSIIQASGRKAWVGGNIGRPLISELEGIREDDLVVQELSSFQLEYWTESPEVAAVLNITPNHLDRHGSMDAYASAKANIVRHQKPSNVALLSADDPGASALQTNVQGRLREFSLDKAVDDGAFVRGRTIWLRDKTNEKPVLDLELIPLRGQHNILNVLASTVLADSAGISTETIREAVAKFEGVEHRLEKVQTVNGVQYINDSIATAPDRAIAAIESFDEPIVLLAGGRDKEMVWDKWARRVLEKVKAVILFGDLADLMESKLDEISAEISPPHPIKIIRQDRMEIAVLEASRIAVPGDIVLLAPGGTSFDAFTDFSQRGEVFRDLVNDIATGSYFIVATG